MAHGSWNQAADTRHKWKCGKTITIQNLFTRLINGMYWLMSSIYPKSGNLWSHSHSLNTRYLTFSFIQLLNTFQVYHSIFVVEIRQISFSSILVFLYFIAHYYMVSRFPNFEFVTEFKNSNENKKRYKNSRPRASLLENFQFTLFKTIKWSFGTLSFEHFHRKMFEAFLYGRTCALFR